MIPTTTLAGSSQWLPSSIIIAATPTGSETTTLQTSIASGVPISVTNGDPTDDLTPPEGMTLVRIGFFKQLNWNFVALNSKSSAQVMTFLPQGLSEGLHLEPEQVQIHSLVPLVGYGDFDYVPTTALIFIATNVVNTLALDLHIPPAPIYQNADPTVNQLMGYINPAIPLIPGTELAGASASGTGSASTPTTVSTTYGGIFNTQSQSQSASATKNTAGWAVGIVGAAAAYGAAMFFVARRYKRKKQSHRRSSSIMSPSEMRQSGSPALVGGAHPYMTGGRSSSGGDRNSRGSGRTGNSARTQQISAPMMAENSLGWN